MIVMKKYITLAMAFGMCSGMYGHATETEANDSVPSEVNRIKMDHALLDAKRRAEIVKSIEEFRQDFDNRNIENIAGKLKNLQIRNDNIFGEGIDSISGASARADKFIEKLREMMSRDTFKSEIENIIVYEHQANPGFYGVNFHQKIQDGDETLDGWWFFLIDTIATDDKMTVHICSWQSNENVIKDGVFTLDDFFIP